MKSAMVRDAGARAQRLRGPSDGEARVDRPGAYVVGIERRMGNLESSGVRARHSEDGAWPYQRHPQGGVCLYAELVESSEMARCAVAYFSCSLLLTTYSATPTARTTPMM